MKKETLNKNQEVLNNYLNGGNKLIQKDNRLWMNGEVVNTKTFVSLMFRLFGGEFNIKMKEFVKIVN